VLQLTLKCRKAGKRLQPHSVKRNQNFLQKGIFKMAQLQQTFDANGVNPTQGAGQLPLGRHPVVIGESNVKANRDNTGGFAEFILSIIDGPNAGQTGAYRLNLYHANPQTVDIAQRQLSALCHVTGQLQIQDTAQLHNHPFMVEVTNQKLSPEQQARVNAGEQVTPYTQVSKVFYIDGREPGKENQAPAQAQTQQHQPQQQAAPAGYGAAPAIGAPIPIAAFAPAAAPAAAWAAPGQQPAAAAPAPAPAPAAAAPAWQTAAPAAAPAAAWAQGAGAAAPAGGKPAWGAR